MAVNPWTFTHLEVTGDNYPFSSNSTDVCGRIPSLRVETRKAEKKPAIPQQLSPQRPKSPRKQELFLSPRPPKQKVVTIKVVLPKQKPRTAERNCLCSCEVNPRRSPRQTRGGISTQQDVDEKISPVENLEFEALLEVLRNYNKGVRKEAAIAIRKLAKEFQASKILSDKEVKEVCLNSVYLHVVDFLTFAVFHGHAN